MMSTILAGAMMMTALVQAADTTIPVEEGMRLNVRNQEGEIRVTTWQRDAVRILASNGDGLQIDADRSGSVLRVRASVRVESDIRERRGRRRSDWGGDGAVDFEITVPAYLDVELSGVGTDMSVVGTSADISAETVNGTVVVRGGNGFIHARSHDGELRVEGASGQIEVNASSGDIWISDVNGDVAAESVNGDIELRNIDGRRITARTVNGGVTFVGVVHDGGRYQLSTHDGDVTASIPEGTNATVSVANFDGDFETRFPIMLRGGSGYKFDFTLGDGSAALVLESFSGDVLLLRR
jgi:DUF4097 and DUF4098 domain-containing protein YvlB